MNRGIMFKLDPDTQRNKQEGFLQTSNVVIQENNNKNRQLVYIN